jgi:hypothetical protein
MAAKAKRTTHRTTSGKKVYAVRDSKGKFKDIQSYKRAQGQDEKRSERSGEEQVASVRGSSPPSVSIACVVV